MTKAEIERQVVEWKRAIAVLEKEFDVVDLYREAAAGGNASAKAALDEMDRGRLSPR